MRETTKTIKNFNSIVRREFNSNKFMNSSEQSARDKFNCYIKLALLHYSKCETPRAKEILEESINIIENRYNEYLKFHNLKEN